MNQQRLDELKMIMEKTTAGPWEEYGGIIYAPNPVGRVVCQVSEPSPPSQKIEHARIERGSPNFEQAIATSKFIAAARSAVPELIAEIERLQAACQGLIDYRDRNSALNFQLEKADDFIHQMRVALEGGAE